MTGNGYRRGDIVVADLDPAAGHEQRKRRYLLVVGNEQFSRTCNLTLACAITSQDNGYPLHLPIHPISMNGTIEGFVEVAQLKALDLKARNAETVGWVPGDEMDRITGMILACIA